MARFNLDDYETVEERIKRFYSLHEDGRIITECVKAGEGGQWLFKAYIYLTEGDQAAGLPKATGYASEVEGGAQTDWKAELGETSCIGRALANMNLSGNKRSSRQEMEKVVRAESKPRDWIAEASKLNDVDALRLLWSEAKAAKAPQKTLDRIKELANGHSDSEREGTK